MSGLVRVPQSERGFCGSLLGSLTLHLLAVLALLAGDWQSSSPGQQIFQVRVVALPATGEPAPPAPRTPAPQRHLTAASTVPVMPIAVPEPIPTSTSAMTTDAANTSGEHLPTFTEAPVPVSGPASSGATYSDSAPPLAEADHGSVYLVGVRAAIEARKDYPMLARRGWQQGTVVVVFHLDRAGRLLSHGVRRSSGHNLLDRAALRAVAQVGQFPPLPEGLSGETAAFEVSITFSMRP